MMFINYTNFVSCDEFKLPGDAILRITYFLIYKKYHFSQAKHGALPIPFENLGIPVIVNIELTSCVGELTPQIFILYNHICSFMLFLPLFCNRKFCLI